MRIEVDPTPGLDWTPLSEQDQQAIQEEPGIELALLLLGCIREIDGQLHYARNRDD